MINIYYYLKDILFSFKPILYYKDDNANTYITWRLVQLQLGISSSLTVLDRVVSDGEFTQVVTNHLWLDLNGVERFTVVDTNERSDHLWNNNHVSQVSLNKNWLTSLGGGQLCLSHLFNQSHWLVIQTSGELSSNSGSTDLGEVLGGHRQQVFQLDTLEREVLKRSLFTF